MNSKLSSDLFKQLLTVYEDSNIVKDDNKLRHFVENACNALLDDESEKKVENLNAEDSQFFNILLCLFVDAAKLNFDKNATISEFAANKCPEVLSKIIGETYDSNKSRLRSKLNQTGWHFPRILDVDWKLDYQVKTSVQEDVCKPNFKISLVTANCKNRAISETLSSDLTNFAFDCSAEQLQDLLWKFKEASKMVEKISHGFK